MFLSREIDMKLCQIYTKIVVLNRSYSTNMLINLKTAISHRSLRISGLLNMILSMKSPIQSTLQPLSRNLRNVQWCMICCKPVNHVRKLDVTLNSSNAPQTSLTIAHSNSPLRTPQQHWRTEILPLSVLPNHENWFLFFPLWLLRPLWPQYLTDCYEHNQLPSSATRQPPHPAPHRGFPTCYWGE